MKRDRCRGCFATLADLWDLGDDGELVRGLCTKCRRRRDRARVAKKFTSKKAKRSLDRAKHGMSDAWGCGAGARGAEDEGRDMKNAGDPTQVRQVRIHSHYDMDVWQSARLEAKRRGMTMSKFVMDALRRALRRAIEMKNF